MQIVITADAEIPVPPRYYGGIERIIEMLVLGLLARGHAVTLFGHPDSTVPCDVVPWADTGRSRRALLRNTAQLFRWIRSHNAGDLVIHSFSRLAYLAPLLPLRLPKIQTYQRHVTPRSARWGHWLGRDTLTFTAISKSCARYGQLPGRWVTIYNGVCVDRYRLTESVSDDAPLMFLGRLERIKGPQHAIAVAQMTGRSLVLAGTVPAAGDERIFCEREVLAQCDGRRIRYVGPVDDAAKNELLGNAACLLFPIDWEEPFGIVMAEALACGTPVIAFGRGAVPEVIEDGVNGFVCRDVTEMAHAVQRLREIKRSTCRRVAEQRFSADILVGQYEALYRAVLGGAFGPIAARVSAP